MAKFEELGEELFAVAKGDVNGLLDAQKFYGDSWKKRGGVGAFMMLARKWDRLENQVKAAGYDVFQAYDVDPAEQGIIDDIRDLRRYLMLVENELRKRKREPKPRIEVTTIGDATPRYVDQG